MGGQRSRFVSIQARIDRLGSDSMLVDVVFLRQAMSPDTQLGRLKCLVRGCESGEAPSAEAAR